MTPYTHPAFSLLYWPILSPPSSITLETHPGSPTSPLEPFTPTHPIAAQPAFTPPTHRICVYISVVRAHDSWGLFNSPVPQIRTVAHPSSPVRTLPHWDEILLQSPSDVPLTVGDVVFQLHPWFGSLRPRILEAFGYGDDAQYGVDGLLFFERFAPRGMDGMGGLCVTVEIWSQLWSRESIGEFWRGRAVRLGAALALVELRIGEGWRVLKGERIAEEGREGDQVLQGRR